MQLLVNDLSVRGQFLTIDSFCEAIERVMTMRRTAQKYEHDVYCHKNLCRAQITTTHSMQQAVNHLQKDKQRAVMQWLTRHGPYWEDKRGHGVNDYFTCNDEVVTESAIGEVAYHCFNERNHRLISFTPSDWETSPLSVVWHHNDDESQTVTCINYTAPNVLEEDLRTMPVPIKTWDELAHISEKRFSSLTFAKDAFLALQGHPFVPGAAQQIMGRLEILQKMTTCFDATGVRSAEGQRLYQEHFTGDKAWFSDSSDSEKSHFRSELSFRHPTKQGETLDCPWHGKIKTPQLRIHFSWPVQHNSPLFIVYVGPKITKG